MTVNDSEQATNNDSSPAEDFETLKLQLELEKLQRQWLEQKPNLTGGYPSQAEPKVSDGIWIGTLMVVVGIVFIGVGLFIFQSGGYSNPEQLGTGIAVVGIVLLGLGVLVGRSYVRQARKYNEAKETYEDRRQ